MSEIKDGGPAFPCLVARNAPNEGMSLRDYFAGQVLTGLVAFDGEHEMNAFAQDAYAIADAMLRAREGK